MDPRLVTSEWDYNLKELSAERNNFFFYSVKNLLPFHPSHEFVCCNFMFSYKGFLSGNEKEARSSLELGESEPFWALLTTRRRPNVLLGKGYFCQLILRIIWGSLHVQSAHYHCSIPLLPYSEKEPECSPPPLPDFCPLWCITCLFSSCLWCHIKTYHGIWLDHLCGYDVLFSRDSFKYSAITHVHLMWKLVPSNRIFNMLTTPFQ